MACSTIAKNFMSELDSLFKLDGDLDSLDKNVHQKYVTPSPSGTPVTCHPINEPHPTRKQAVTTQTQELEALELRLREAEDRLKQASSNSPPRRKDSQRRSPLAGAFPAQDKARIEATKTIAGALQPTTPASQNSADYVLVERPHSSRTVEAEKA
jgi:hypothetical protein